MPQSITNLLPDIIVDIVDIGANLIDGDPPYARLVKEGRAKVVGFEPNEAALQGLLAVKGPHETYLPYAVGDGQKHVFNLCKGPGMSSLLKPDRELLENFYGFPEWATVMNQVEVETKRLDDISEIGAMDFLKIDIQGYELNVLMHGVQKLQETLVIQTEVEFLPMYENQALFAEVDLFLRLQGFMLHKLYPIVTRTFQPMLVNNDIYQGLNQVLWTDAVYVRNFRTFDNMSPEKLGSLAVILHEVYNSWDLALRALMSRDRQLGGDESARYMRSFAPKSADSELEQALTRLRKLAADPTAEPVPQFPRHTPKLGAYVGDLSPAEFREAIGCPPQTID
ncbi:MAG: FkbM family methyltransferase [Bryobacteraceae bacterium]